MSAPAIGQSFLGATPPPPAAPSTPTVATAIPLPATPEAKQYAFALRLRGATDDELVYDDADSPERFKTSRLFGRDWIAFSDGTLVCPADIAMLKPVSEDEAKAIEAEAVAETPAAPAEEDDGPDLLPCATCQRPFFAFVGDETLCVDCRKAAPAVPPSAPKPAEASVA